MLVQTDFLLLGIDFMPKMKTNRMAYKKLRVGGTGRVKRALAGASHNSGKKSAKRIRQLRVRKVLDSTNVSAVARQLPYLGVKPS
jgi:large subunit ribosomal protein L35